MYKVLIADDEHFVTALVRDSIDWTTLDLELVGEAESGSEAYEKILTLHPDIVITDIRMPGLSGIELMEKVRLTGLKVEFIILSGYNSFGYAQEAIKYHAVSFILKPLEEKELHHALQQAIDHLSNEQTILQTVAQAKNQREELRQEFLLKAIRNKKEPTVPLTLDEINQKYDCHFQEGQFLAFIAHMERLPDAGILEKMIEISLSFLQTSAYDCYHMIEGRHLVLLINMPFSPSEDYASMARELFRRQSSLIQHTGIALTAALGCVVASWQRLSQAYETACCLLRDRLIDGLGRLYLYQKQSVRQELPLAQLPLRRELKLTMLIETFETEELERNLNDIIDQLVKISGKSSHLFLVLEQIIKIYRQTTMQMCISSEIGVLTSQQYMERMEECDTLPQLKQLLRDLFVLPLCTYYLNQRQNETNLSVQIRRYVSLHYQENIRLIDVANYLDRNPSYTGYIFKRDTGTSFAEYLSAYRINIAKSFLLETSLTISNVAEIVGFCDMHHFSKTFKKLVGMNPSVYRRKSGG